MASDLLIGYACLALVAAGMFLLTCWATRSFSPLRCTLAAIVVVALLFVYIRTLWYDVRLAQWLPLSNLVVIGNWLPLFTAVMAGLAWRHGTGTTFRRTITTTLLASVGALAAAYPLLGSVPDCRDRWDKMETCLQTTRFTCSPAAAATLLRRYGIEASEQEMAELCLTRRGTSWQGLYRGLKLKTAGTDWDVQVCQCTADELQSLYQAPMILSVGLDDAAPADSDFTREFGWVPGVNHSVVLEGFGSNRCATVSDPAYEMSREQWDPESLRILYRGYAIRLVRRN